MLPKVIIGLLVVLTIGFLVKESYLKENGQSNNKIFSIPTQPEIISDNEPPLKIKHLGFDLDYYNPEAKKAGAMDFTLIPFEDRLWTDFGYKDSQSGKIHPQPIFQLPVGTKVYAIADGVVVDIPKLYSGDYSIHVAIDQNSRWRYETEHVVNVKVKVGDKVTAGQEIAEVGPDNNRNYGFLDIGILKGGNPPEHVCPFAYLDDSIKEETLAKIRVLYKSWENFRGDTTIYNEDSMPVIGCLTLDEVDG